jgi:hypothetical protein
MMRSAPRRQKGQVAISRSNTRRSSLAQLQRGGPVLASCPSTPCWRGVGVIAPRRLLCGAKQPHTANSAVSEVTGHVLGYTVHMRTMQAKNRCRQGQPSRCTTRSRCRRRRQLYVCGTPAKPSPAKEEDRSPRRGHWGWARCRPRCYAWLAARPVCAAHGGPDRVTPAGGRGGAPGSGWPWLLRERTPGRAGWPWSSGDKEFLGQSVYNRAPSVTTRP